MGLEHAVGQFTAFLAASGEYRGTTARCYCTDLRQFVSFARRIGVLFASDVTSVHVEAFKESLASLRLTTISRKLAAVSAFFDWLWRKGVVGSNLAAPVKRPRKRTADTKWVTPEDAVALLAACRDDRERAIIATYLRAALRSSELVNLRLGDLDLLRNEMHITGKGGCRRTIPILSDLRPYLVRWLSVRGECDHDFVFTTRSGRPLRQKACWRLLRRLAKAAGCTHKGYTIHSLRHGAATQMYEAGVDIGTIARFLRHSDLSTVSRYVHAGTETLRRQIEAKNDETTLCSAASASPPNGRHCLSCARSCLSSGLLAAGSRSGIGSLYAGALKR